MNNSSRKDLLHLTYRKCYYTVLFSCPVSLCYFWLLLSLSIFFDLAITMRLSSMSTNHPLLGCPTKTRSYISRSLSYLRNNHSIVQFWFSSRSPHSLSRFSRLPLSFCHFLTPASFLLFYTPLTVLSFGFSPSPEFLDRKSVKMSTSAYGSYSEPMTPCSAFIDPKICTLRAFQPGHLFWSATATDAMALRDQKFKAYSHRAPRSPPPQFEDHYDDHYTISSKKPKFPVDPVEEQVRPKQKHSPNVEFMTYFITFFTLVFAMWCLGLIVSISSWQAPLVGISLLCVKIMVCLLTWLGKKKEEFEYY